MTASTPTEITRPSIRFCETTIAVSSGSVDCGNWEIVDGEAWFVAGGMATGKTALLRAMAGLEQPLRGRIERFGTDWAGFSESETLKHRRRIGVVLGREAGLFHRLTVLENIHLPLHYHGGRSLQEIHERARSLLAALDIENYAHVPSMRVGPSVSRRALIARSLALGPEVLLLDDPCAGLDEWDRRRLIHFLGRLRAGEELIEGRPATLVMTGASPADWREFPELKWARLGEGRLATVPAWEQLVATAPELFHDPDSDDSPD